MRAHDDDRNEVALALMEECAAEGDPVACYLAALWHRDGDSANADPPRCSYWIHQLVELAEQGNPEAQWELSGMCRCGDLLPIDISQANHWLARAAESGFGEAQHHLAWYLETGQYNLPIDAEASESWYRRAFEQRHPETLYTFALREFKDGKITASAVALLREAADKGFKQAADVLREYTH